MNGSSAQIEKVLDLIYDAAVENDLWRDVLTTIADLTHSQGGILFGQSMTAQKVYFDFNGRLDEACNRAYQERHTQNPWSEGMQHRPVGRLVMSEELIEPSALRATAFYDEVLRPQGLGHNGMMALAARDDFRAAFNLCRSERDGQLDCAAQRLLEWLSPHLCRSVALGFRIDAYLALQRAAFDVLEHLADGTIVLDRGCRVIFANAAARRFESEGLLRLRQVISTCSSAHTQRLTELVRASLQGAPGGSLSLPRDADGHLLTVLVCAMRAKDIGRLSDMGMKDAAVLVFVIDPLSRRSIPLTQLMAAYGLTRAEARVALAVSSGKTIAETAQFLRISPNTIKTHLRRVFAKTATGRQAELAGLIGAIGGARTPAVDGQH